MSRTPELVSIVVTSYNHAEFLPKRLESLLAQTYRPIEIIVVDDHSSDDSLTVLRRWESNPLVRIVPSERNSGVAAASNKGAALASGEYLMFAECDDYDRPEHVGRLVGALKSTTAGAAFSRSDVVDAHDVVVGDDFHVRESAFRALCSKDVLIRRSLMRRFLLRANVIPNMSAALMRRDCFDAAGGASSAYRLCADWALWLRLARENDVFYVAESLNCFRTHETTARSTFDIALQVDEIYSILFSAAQGMDLSFADALKFRVGAARVWAGYFSADPGRWLSSFGRVWLKTLRYDGFSLVSLAVAVIAKPLGLRLSLAETAAG
jgi:glycosyltransferase involved in cell wall biosynthesis